MSLRETRVRAVLVEDEPHARHSLREYSAEVEWLTLVGEACDGAEAVRLIDRLEPDLVFLDVELPELSGLQVVERIHHRPEIVFTTAYDRFALAAFEIGALDYLLKPFGRQRFHTMLQRVRRQLVPSAVPSTERARAAFGSPLRLLFARTRDGIVPIEARTIRHIRASGDYVEVTCETGSHLLHTSLGELASRLDPEVFLQVHRSHIVNLEAVELLRPFDERRLLIKLRDGKEIVASRSASELLRRLVR
ncbi:MAG TPA: LytTR family DNA-binding domain-containing protein [Thermoanaerobaculia bacterium]|jgi:two-component system LytT family response regulator|nr:LytTR family DNA-binding domain-containing protein [Thermoanaerobaculia bacterium]